MTVRGLVVVIVILLGSLVMAGVLLSGRGMPSSSNEDDQLIVAATIFPLADIVQQVGGEAVRVVQLIPSGASPHSYQLTPAQVTSLQQARVIFAIGHGLDDAVVSSVLKISDGSAVIVDEGIALRQLEGQDDPHYWLMVPNAEQIVLNVARSLARLDPVRAAQYQTNADRYTGELAELESELQAVAKTAEQRSFIALHDAWSYFADQYGFVLVASYEPVEGRQPSVADLQRLGELIKQHSISVFYTEPQKTQASAARFLASELEELGIPRPDKSTPAITSDPSNITITTTKPRTVIAQL